MSSRVRVTKFTNGLPEVDFGASEDFDLQSVMQGIGVEQDVVAVHHFAISGLMHEAALKAGEDPDRLSFLHAVRVVRRKLAVYGAIPPKAEDGLS